VPPLPEARPAVAAAPVQAEAASAPIPAGARFVVQIGAYSDAARLREARQRVERLGLKTYTQVIETDGGKRTRVRIGPYASREEADAAAAKVKGAGLPANILAL
jgi:DedD protein